MFVGLRSLESCFRGLLLEIDGFLIICDCSLQSLGLFRGIGLLRRRSAIGIGQLEPEQVPRGVHLCGFGQNLNRGVVIASRRGLGGSGKLLIQRLHCVCFFRRLFLLLLDLLQLLGSHSLLLSSLGLFLLQVKVHRDFIQTHRNICVME